MEYELEVRYDARKSFYGKANITEQDGKRTLRSYNTEVAYIENGVAVVLGQYSQTTLRHIKEFLKQDGFKAEDWKQIEKDYSQTKEQEKQRRSEKEENSNSMLKSIGLIASLGGIMCNEKKGQNEWKLRMLKAGLQNKGLIVPEDWETLTEEEKSKRLDGVIAIATGKNKEIKK